MNKTLSLAAAAVAGTLLCTAAAAQSGLWVGKVGAIRYAPDSSTSGIQGIGVPPGADAKVGDATTVIFVLERTLTPNLGAELVLGVPPRIKARATGTVAFLGDDVLSAKNVSPTVLLNYYFGDPGDRFRPYVGGGINYTRFASARTKLAPKVELSDSTGLALQVGLNVAIDKQWGLFGSIARVDTKSDLVATGSSVLTTTIDFRPTTYSLGVWYRY